MGQLIVEWVVWRWLCRGCVRVCVCVDAFDRSRMHTLLSSLSTHSELQEDVRKPNGLIVEWVVRSVCVRVWMRLHAKVVCML